MTPDLDADDVAKVVAGDLSAFDCIVGRWQRRLVNLAWRFCRDRHQAEDMAQEAFLRAFRSLSSFREESAFATWLTAIALNTYRSHLRRHGPPVVPLSDERQLVTAHDVLGSLIARETDERVRRAVLSLPDRYRDALVVFYFEDRNLIETARQLGVPIGTLKARLHRGRVLLERRVSALLGCRRNPHEPRPGKPNEPEKEPSE
jgi:RNA polymerase sigma-70 factor (ECF subfamily)